MPRRETLADTGRRSDDAHGLVAVLYDDRPTALTGLKLAALSLLATSPGLEVRALVPGADDVFARWAAAHGVMASTAPLGRPVTGWDVKPTVLLETLDTGAETVLWFDTDIVATQDVRRLLDRHPAEVLVATEEYAWGHHQGSTARTTRLGFEIGRVLPRSVNSGVLRVGPSHRPLLAEWAAILARADYVKAQSLDARRRPIAYLGDQEVLGGLLGSRNYADVPLAQLRRGTDIAQCFGPSGFTAAERWRARHRLPPLVHAMGRKPWSRPQPQDASLRARVRFAWENAHLDLTPYVETARPYLSGLGEPTDWVGPVTAIGRLLSRIGAPALREMPLTLLDEVQRALRRGASIGQVPA